jgi:hypothetical protein
MSFLVSTRCPLCDGVNVYARVLQEGGKLRLLPTEQRGVIEIWCADCDGPSNVLPLIRNSPEDVATRGLKEKKVSA